MPYSVWPSAATRAAPSTGGVVEQPGAGSLALLGKVPIIVTSGSFSTNFPATENPISQGGIWVNGKATGVDWNNVQTNGSGAFATTRPTPGNFDDCIACLTTAFNNAQYAEGVAHRVSGYNAGHEIELLLRFNISANSASGYECYFSTDTEVEIVRWNGPLNSFTVLNATSVIIADGDVLRFEASGSSLTAYRNGSVLLTATDNTWSSGHPGIGLNAWDPGSVNLTSYGWKSFAAGNL